MLQAEIESQLTLCLSDILPQGHHHSLHKWRNFLHICYKLPKCSIHEKSYCISAYVAAGKFPTQVPNSRLSNWSRLMKAQLFSSRYETLDYLHIYLEWWKLVSNQPYLLDELVTEWCTGARDSPSGQLSTSFELKIFPSSWPFTWVSLKSLIYATIYSLLEETRRVLLHAFSKGINVKGNANIFIQDLDQIC